MDERGRQPERTALSWFRTVLGFVAVGILALRQPTSVAGEVVTVSVVVPTLIAVSVVATLRTRELRSMARVTPAELAAPARRTTLAMTLGVLSVGLLALVFAP